MKADELKRLTSEELSQELLQLLKRQFEFRMQLASGQLTQSHLLRKTRRQIAVLKTIMSQNHQGGAR